MKTKLQVVKKPEVEFDMETTWIDFFAMPPRQVLHTDADLDEEWQARQRINDRNRRPVEAVKAVRKSLRAVQMELFRSDHEVVFQSDMLLEKLDYKFDKGSERVNVKVVLILDVFPEVFHELFEPIFKLKSKQVDVLLAGTKVAARDL